MEQKFHLFWTAFASQLDPYMPLLLPHDLPELPLFQDKSADVRKAAEAFFGEIVRVCGPELVMKNVRDIQGPALAIVLERLKSHGGVPDAHESTKTAAPSWQAVKTKVGKSNGHGAKHGTRAGSSRAVSTKASKPEPIMSVQDINIQSQALLNVKDSNKDERERIVVRRYKFEELRLEQIQELEVAIFLVLP